MKYIRIQTLGTHKKALFAGVEVTQRPNAKMGRTTIILYYSYMKYLHLKMHILLALLGQLSTVILN